MVNQLDSSFLIFNDGDHCVERQRNGLLKISALILLDVNPTLS